MYYSAQFLLFDEIVYYPPLGIFVSRERFFIYIMQQIEIIIFHTALFQLQLKCRLRVKAVRYNMPRIFSRQIVAVSRLFGQCLSHSDL